MKYFNGNKFTLADALAKTEKQINEQNKKFVDGKSTFYEELNEFSDLTRSQFEKEKTGAILPQGGEGRGRGAFLPDQSEWYTSPELLELYASRASVPEFWDSTAIGNYLISIEP